MNRKLRNRHRIAMTALGVALPVVFVAGLAVRPTPAITERLPVLLTATAAEFTDAGGQPRVIRIDGADVEVRLLSDDQGRLAISVAPAPGATVVHADVLVYWTAGDPSAMTQPAPDAYLLGTLAGAQRRVLGLPPEAAANQGYVSFYSLAAKATLPPVVSLEGS